jgi:threonylcarbamoyladenosine tRNA methylthiotransferase MtaB
MLKTFAIETLGCKVNQYESQQIRTLLCGLGLRAAARGEKPDLTVVNTCCVTKNASAKSRQYIRKAKKLSPCSTVVALGCLTAAPQQEFKSLANHVHLIKNRPAIAAELSTIVLKSTARLSSPKSTPGQHQPQLDSRPCSARPATQGKEAQTAAHQTIKAQNRAEIKAKNRSNFPKLPDLTSFAGHTRAFLKAQDGCDAYCTYCIIPTVRPLIENRSVDSLCREAERLVKSGHKEIVLTGICLGAYGRDTARRRNWPDDGKDYLAELLDRLAQTPNLPRLRVSSLNPQDVTERLLNVFANHSNIMPHLHVSLQSGSDKVLRRMARQYSAEKYLEKVRMIKARLDNPAIATDVIVGFPGETESDFADTVALCRTVGFARIHVFSFSARKGTAAEKMTPKVKSQVIKQRAAILHELADQLASEYRDRFIGQTERVLIESVEDGVACGRAERYFEVKIPDASSKLHRNDIVDVTLIENTPTCIIASINAKAGV